MYVLRFLLFSITISCCILANIADPHFATTCQIIKVTLYGYDDCESENTLITKGDLDIAADKCLLKMSGGVEIHGFLKGTWMATFLANGVERNVTDVCTYISYDGEDDGGAMTQLVFDAVGLSKEDSCDKEKGLRTREEEFIIDLNSYVDTIRRYEGNHTIDLKAYDEEGKVIGCLQAFIGVEEVVPESNAG